MKNRPQYSRSVGTIGAIACSLEQAPQLAMMRVARQPTNQSKNRLPTRREAAGWEVGVDALVRLNLR